MKKFLRKADFVSVKLTYGLFTVALLFLSIGAVIWSVQWVLKLVGVM